MKPYRRVEIVKETRDYRWIRIEDRRYKTGWKPTEKVKRNHIQEMWDKKMIETIMKPNPFIKLLSKGK